MNYNQQLEINVKVKVEVYADAFLEWAIVDREGYVFSSIMVAGLASDGRFTLTLEDIASSFESIPIHLITLVPEWEDDFVDLMNEHPNHDEVYVEDLDITFILSKEKDHE